MEMHQMRKNNISQGTMATIIIMILAALQIAVLVSLIASQGKTKKSLEKLERLMKQEYDRT